MLCSRYIQHSLLYSCEPTHFYYNLFVLETYENRMEIEFEYGYNLKVYPDDPIQVAMKGQGGKTDGPSFGNWISNLLSPVDASGVPPPTAMMGEEKN